MAEAPDQTRAKLLVARAIAVGQSPANVIAEQRIELHTEAMDVGGYSLALTISTLIDTVRENKLKADEFDRAFQMIVDSIKPGDTNTQIVNTGSASAPVFAPRAASASTSAAVSQVEATNLNTGEGTMTIGRPAKATKTLRSNPWVSGSFYLTVVVVLLVVLLVMARTVSPWLLPVVLVAGVLLACVIGAFQLRNDDKLSERNFLQLMRMTFKELPLIRAFAKKTPEDDKQLPE